ncbi:unnamed protein product [Penicillium salamii]|uniref:Uncharacterized protein n=1 Tax=Penicillium salamii TaxID=1612424 RepID=A0A9W4IXE8_9EURO|nr:unnamed protein product [Penicillium salamii]CAG8365723.1 unnamed protein product [Penicillium salamii]CAG8367149.1 unnamed protein product [Penicillium salamii]CAG8382464.1 unnamed protein product [Penicillium salamii]
MAPTVQQPTTYIPDAEIPRIDGGTWKRTQQGTWTRPCSGGETGVSYNQNVRDGHTELTIQVPFNINLSTRELVQRFRNAWLVSHSRTPEIAVQLSTGTELPQMMKYEVLHSDAEAAAWMQETFHVVTDQNAADVVNMTYNRRMPTKGKRNMMYLVTGPHADPQNPTQHTLVWNLSHAVADVYSIVQFLNHFFKTVTQVAGDRDYSVSQIDYSGVVGRLPISPLTPYQEQYKPNQEQIQQAIADAARQGDMYNSKMGQSVAMYPEEDIAERDHKTHCIRLQYSLEQSRALLAQLREEKISITFATAAATVLAVKQTYAKGHETGALLGMTRNARRWVDTNGQAGKIPAAADCVFLWIPFEQQWFQGSTRDSVLHIARAIRKELGPHLVSPHYISSMNFTSARAVEGLAASKEPTAAPCAPGFSPQGALGLERDFESPTASIQVHDFIHTGRQINDSAWVGMFSLWDRITLSIGFDGKYYDPAGMDTFMALTKSNLASIIPRRFKRGITSRL